MSSNDVYDNVYFSRNCCYVPIKYYVTYFFIVSCDNIFDFQFL